MPGATRDPLAVVPDRSRNIGATRSNGLRPSGAVAAALTAVCVASVSAGCSAGGVDGSGATPPDEVLTVEEAGETYLRLASGFDPALDPFYDEYSRASPSLPELRNAAQDAARASEDFAAELSDVAWPEEVDTSAVSAVVQDYEVYAGQWDGVAAAASLGKVEQLLCDMDADVAAAEENVNRLRSELDLEPVEWGEDSSCDTSGDDDRVFGDDAVTP